MNVVVVEDEGIMALFLKENLEKQGHTVLACFNEAIKLFEFLEEGHEVDLILMDILLKGKIDGIQAAQFIHQNYKNISLSFITSYKDSQTIKDAQRAFPIGYLIKPISENDLEAFMMTSENLIKPKTSEIKMDSNLIKIANYTYNKDSKVLYEPNGQIAKLSLNEINCLDVLIKNRDTYVSQEQLITTIWDNYSEKTASSLRELIYRIRKKLPDLDISSSPSIGYILKS